MLAVQMECCTVYFIYEVLICVNYARYQGPTNFNSTVIASYNYSMMLSFQLSDCSACVTVCILFVVENFCSFNDLNSDCKPFSGNASFNSYIQ